MTTTETATEETVTKHEEADQFLDLLGDRVEEVIMELHVTDENVPHWKIVTWGWTKCDSIGYYLYINDKIDGEIKASSHLEATSIALKKIHAILNEVNDAKKVLSRYPVVVLPQA